MLKLTGLWQNTSKATGKKYYSGKVGNTRFMAFKNDKRGDNDPDLTLHIAKVDDNADWTFVPEEPEAERERANRSPSGAPYPRGGGGGESFADLDDEIPFITSWGSL